MLRGRLLATSPWGERAFQVPRFARRQGLRTRALGVLIALSVVILGQAKGAEAPAMSAGVSLPESSANHLPLRGAWVASSRYHTGDVVFTTHEPTGDYRLCYFVAKANPMVLQVPNTDIPPSLSSHPDDAFAYWSAWTPGCATPVAPSRVIAVPGLAAPWSSAGNPAFAAQAEHDVTAPPIRIPLAAFGVAGGRSITLQCIGGVANAGGLPDSGCLGLTEFPPTNALFNDTGCHSYFPSRYVDLADYPVFTMQLIGVFTNERREVVGRPFVVSRARRAVSIPAAATHLQLGFNDCLYGPGDGGGANTGALIVAVSVTP
jgi:hypothetical protein